MTHPLAPVFEPRSVAVVGASSDAEKRGHQVVAALQASGFPGEVFPINPKGGSLLGLPVYEAIDATPNPPDLVYVARPAAAVPDEIAACGRHGVRAAIVPAVGFRESGTSGAELEARALAAARETGVRLIGPNTSGLLNTHAGLHMVGGEPLARGSLAIVAQSGNIALDLMTTASARPIGVSIYVGPGNETDIGFHEYLDYLGQHEPTTAIAVYLEGVRDGEALFETATRVSRSTPIVALKGGRSDSGVRTARSHTGAIAGSYETFRALAREAGLIEVTRADELLPVAETVGTQPPLTGRGLCVLSDGGGHATLAADHLAAAGVELAELAEDTRTRLAALLGPAANVANPIDVAGATDREPGVFVEALRVLTDDPACGGVLLIGLFGGYSIRFSSALAEEEEAAAAGLASLCAAARIPLVVHSLYAHRDPPALRRLSDARVPVFGSLELAVRSIVALDAWGRRSATPRALSTRRPMSERSKPASTARVGSADLPTHSPAETKGPARVAEKERRTWLSERETRALLERHDVPLVPAEFAADASAAARAAPSGRRAAVKVVSRHLPHKTEAGAVALDLEGAAAIEEAFEATVASAVAYLKRHGLPHDVEGALVSPMLPAPIAELVVAARRDPQYGPVIVVGVGGVGVELFRDVVIRRAPVSKKAVHEMSADLRLAPLLFGHRGAPRVDIESLASLAVALGECLLGDDGLVEIELNPVFAYEDRVVAVDAVAVATTQG